MVGSRGARAVISVGFGWIASWGLSHLRARRTFCRLRSGDRCQLGYHFKGVRLATEAINGTISKVQGCNGSARRSEAPHA
jgi:hypothetical protein